MLNFIIYENDKSYRSKYISVILKITGGINNAYKIIEIEKYDNRIISKIDNLIGKKIYILAVDVPGKSGLDFAREIRNSGDWESQMIVVTTHEQLRIPALSSKLLMLDFISKFYNCEESLSESLKLSIDIVSSYKSLNFQLNGEIVQIPYKDILFIEKNVDDNYCTIITKHNQIKIRKSITMIENQLSNDPRFFRTHRSCIVNLNNITSVELKTSIIHFDDISTPLLSRDKKSILKNKLCKKSNISNIKITN